MKRYKTKTLILSLICLFIVGLVFGGIYLFSNNDVDEKLVFSDEQMDEFLDAYTEMKTNGEEENVLIVTSPNRPNDNNTINVVEGPNQTYFLMYDSAEARDEAYERFEMDDSTSVDKNIEMQLVSHNSWGIEAMGLDRAIEAIRDGGEMVKVAVIDTGLDVDLFRDNYPDRALSTYDVETNSEAFEDMVDNNGHGTHIAGTVADGTPSSVSIIAMRASRGEKDSVYVSDVTTAIYKAINDGAKAINLSLGAYEQVNSQKIALEYAKNMGVVVVAAAGNDGVSDILYPAGYDSTLSISAVYPNMSFASFSNYGEKIDFTAPGVNIRSINGIQHGTSMATPHVVAAVAILKSFNPSLSFDDVKSLLIEHSQDLGEEGWDQQFGYGFVDFNDAEFCDGEHCDKYGVFLEDDEQLNPEIEINDQTDGIAEITTLNDGLKITADEACMVIVNNNDSYEKVVANKIADAENTYKFELDIEDDLNVMVVLKGDGDLDGTVSSSDSNLINRSLISSNLKPYRVLSELEKIIFDVDDDSIISTSDSNLINRSLITPNLAPYRKINW